jgi:hypothetical protein
LKEEEALTLIRVAHDIEEAIFVGQRIIVLGQPPHTASVVLENLGAGDPAFRRTAVYAERAEQLRRALRAPAPNKAGPPHRVPRASRRASRSARRWSASSAFRRSSSVSRMSGGTGAGRPSRSRAT